MGRSAVVEQDYATALDNLRLLAQRDLLSWWDATSELSFAAQRSTLAEPFEAIVATYGEQAAYAAADYLFLTRSLDETLAQLEYPEVASPIDFEQARASYRYAMWLKEYSEDPADRAVAQRKLASVVNRLVTAPAHETVWRGTQKAGTRFARVPEPGACPFCLMLASRGAVYSQKTVLGEMARFHDNCRCLGIEVKTDDDLPQINRDLEAAWDKGVSKTSTQGDQYKEWADYLRDRRLVAAQQVVFPEIPGVQVPSYGSATRLVAGKEEALPPLNQVPGHVLFNWIVPRKVYESGVSVTADESRGLYVLDRSRGHTADSVQPGKTLFPQSWSDQKIVDAIRDTIEHGTIEASDDGERTATLLVDGVKVQAKWSIIDGQPVQPYGYPCYTDGSDGVIKNPKSPRKRKEA